MAKPNGAARKLKSSEISANIPWLDHTLTILFGGLTLWLFYILRTDVTAIVQLVGFTAGTAVAILATRKAAASIGRAIDTVGNLNKAIVMKKFVDQSWQYAIHISMTLFELYVISDEDWWSDTRTLWHPFRQAPKASLKLLYLTQLGIWICTAFSHRFLQARQKDYFEMYIHHVVTLGLIIGSYSVGYLRVGALVLLVHDSSDIFIDTLKLTNYLKWEGPKFLFCVEIAYVSSVVSWIILRLYLFPFKIIHSSLFETGLTYPSAQAREPNGSRPTNTAENILIGLLMALQLLHVWWFFLIARIGWKIVVGVDPHAAGQDEYEGVSDESDIDHDGDKDKANKGMSKKTS